MDKNKKVGFVGTGNMGGALVRAVRRAGYECRLYDKDAEKAAALAAETESYASTGLSELFEKCEYVFLGVKPNGLSALAAELEGEGVTKAPVLISMAAGKSLQKLETVFGDRAIIRIMPNTSVAYGEGMTLWCANGKVEDEAKNDFLDMMSLSGRLDNIPEGLIDAASALSGCGPAFMYMFLEALADGGVRCGLPRDKATLYAAQTMIGAATALLESGKHPEALKDAVCSPGGTTIEGVRALEKGGLRSCAVEAVIASYEKTFKLK